jgi:hypothetical protein
LNPPRRIKIGVRGFPERVESAEAG